MLLAMGYLSHDASYNQAIARDLVVTRQTGSSGEWPFEEYLRRACAVVLKP
jgi:hypothetical protein